MLIKSKYYFSIPVILLLLIYQSVVYHIKYMIQENNIKDIEYYNKIKYYINIIIIVITIIGFIEYIYNKYLEHKKDFSIINLILSKCKI